ncbi:type II toxin-antitoxin system VapC family toxin [Nostoc sp. FACHB-87]|uniref:type II toxin-antitoxin system VapC family toxin n=1 Tax=Nostocaceae TaxID=1162 RepID=UPI00168535E0|nr:MULTISPECIES: type II toxin-antitoxin system VapC family toxin [Nostocaceae]MBD2456639.1 type II toxin-antitoxin system VapC family toxin [Nostoc sp. FACHB-87]MBD2477988.1 type II toxin-antitoxin system VapC family toxin [Anabaena sp. FACHB-83]
MNYLLDTHTLLWWLNNDLKLSREAREIISNPENKIFVSAVSAWEISIKKATGKLSAPDNLAEAISVNCFESLLISIEHGLKAGSLPNYHNDPFDRMLIAQAMSENLIIISRDAQFSQYGVNVISA